MALQHPLALIPPEIFYHICEYISFTDVVSLHGAYGVAPPLVVHDYMMQRGLKSTKYPLHKLAKVQRADCIRYFSCDPAVDVNLRDQLGQTALHVAAQKGAVAVVKALLRFPWINMDIRDRHSNSPLFLAIWKRHMPVIELLLQEGASHRGALMLAVKTCYLDLVKLLVSVDGVDVNETNEANCSALFLTVKYGRSSICRELLSRKDVNTELRDRRNLWTPLLLAACLGNVSIMLLLLAYGDVNVHATDSEERTALSLAAEEGSRSNVLLLLSQDVDPHRVDRLGRSAMHFAAQRGHEQVLDLLLHKGCNCQLRDSTGMTPIRLAVKAKNNAMIDMMLQAASSINYDDLLMAAAEYNNVWVAGKALRHVSPNIRHRGTTPLLLTMKPAFARFLLADPRIDVNQSDQFHRNLLMQAARRGWLSVVRVLVARNGLNIDQVDNNCQTARDYAQSMGFGAILNLLSDYPSRRSQLQRAWG